MTRFASRRRARASSARVSPRGALLTRRFPARSGLLGERPRAARLTDRARARARRRREGSCRARCTRRTPGLLAEIPGATRDARGARRRPECRRVRARGAGRATLPRRPLRQPERPARAKLAHGHVTRTLLRRERPGGTRRAGPIPSRAEEARRTGRAGSAPLAGGARRALERHMTRIRVVRGVATVAAPAERVLRLRIPRDREREDAVHRLHRVATRTVARADLEAEPVAARQADADVPEHALLPDHTSRVHDW